MEEYRSIINSSKAPRLPMMAFLKLDGSNFRAKYTPSKGFHVFGLRRQLIDETTVYTTKDGQAQYWGEAVKAFKRDQAKPLTELFKTKEFRDYKEITIFGEFWGHKSEYGTHAWGEDDHKRIFVFDILLGHKERKLMLPQDFVKTISPVVETPKMVYEGNLTDQFIKDVREDKPGTLNMLGVPDEGIICKGKYRSGAFFGGVWMCKIKTQEYYNRIYKRFGAEGVNKLWE